MSSKVKEIKDVDPASRTFSTSMLISGIRCSLTYVIFPWLLPAFGIAGGIGPTFGLVIGGVAIAFNALSMRRFWNTQHRFRWLVLPINAGVIILLLILVGIEIAELL